MDSSAIRVLSFSKSTTRFVFYFYWFLVIGYSTVVLLIKTHFCFLIKKNYDFDKFNFYCLECFRVQGTFVQIE